MEPTGKLQLSRNACQQLPESGKLSKSGESQVTGNNDNTGKEQSTPVKAKTDTESKKPDAPNHDFPATSSNTNSSPTSPTPTNQQLIITSNDKSFTILCYCEGYVTPPVQSSNGMIVKSEGKGGTRYRNLEGFYDGNHAATKNYHERLPAEEVRASRKAKSGRDVTQVNQNDPVSNTRSDTSAALKWFFETEGQATFHCEECH
ncbi:hypothetical protein LTR99_006252 [Exophiala xenobiotica]|uniref:Uncharacterized protein n=1 Tax=Vermiconidia calcicola TaxID=1690605 RepID=A0AAV9QBG9_9PEZI|nr:hypothetical protein LTR99_006252 [Exophiala xenobiotica]KAK5430619.1 hypothetical protein LTR34_006347 [Exophiala xenobiotica]KAK5534196.1 hypothetical protein LTR23_008868 [Chaetothyriales sp. CCFEE 6169]KAK5537423.1 hypothetical protein LTR25_004674 [Vermiconidia calcicola]KAK5552973.1 hypothetical protein LTR46_009048 [Exophiala xenobiotica]